MVSEDDTGGLEKLSRLFEHGTLSLPVVPDARPADPAPPTPASAFGGAVLVTAPVSGRRAAAEAPRAPFSPPPLVPATPAWSGASASTPAPGASGSAPGPATMVATPPAVETIVPPAVPTAVTPAAPAPASATVPPPLVEPPAAASPRDAPPAEVPPVPVTPIDAPPVAPAFGGAVIAGRRSGHAAPAAAAVPPAQRDDGLPPTALLETARPSFSPVAPPAAAATSAAAAASLAPPTPIPAPAPAASPAAPVSAAQVAPSGTPPVAGATISAPVVPTPAPGFTAAPGLLPAPAAQPSPVGASATTAHAAPAAPVAAEPPAASRPRTTGAPLDPRRPLLADAPPPEEIDEDEVARSTLLEKVVFVLAFIVPPVGLIGSIVMAIRSSRSRGWAIGLTKAGIAAGVVFSVIAAGGAYAGYKTYRTQQAHDQVAAASAPFCAAVAKDPTLLSTDGGWPAPGSSIPDSIASMQAFVDRWTALGKISPAGLQGGISGVGAAGSQIISAVNAQRTIDDAQNRSVMQAAVRNAGVVGWRAEYCR